MIDDLSGLILPFLIGFVLRVYYRPSAFLDVWIVDAAAGVVGGVKEVIPKVRSLRISASSLLCNLHPGDQTGDG